MSIMAVFYTCTAPKRPPLGGGCQKSLISDWGRELIVTLSPSVSSYGDPFTNVQLPLAIVHPIRFATLSEGGFGRSRANRKITESKHI